jgi:FKBP-type peptidyl-prolyl cis-trans isomerase
LKNIKIAAFALLALTSVFYTFAGAAETELQRFQRLYDDMHEAMNQRKPDKILSYLTSDFLSIELSNQTQTAEQMVASIAALPKPTNQQDSKTTVLSATSDGKTAEIEQSYLSIKVKTDNSGTKITTEFKAKSHDTWRLSSGKWLMKSTRTDELEMKTNGVIILHKQRPSI